MISNFSAKELFVPPRSEPFPLWFPSPMTRTVWGPGSLKPHELLLVMLCCSSQWKAGPLIRCDYHWLVYQLSLHPSLYTCYFEMQTSLPRTEFPVKAVPISLGPISIILRSERCEVLKVSYIIMCQTSATLKNKKYIPHKTLMSTSWLNTIDLKTFLY